VIIYLIQTLVAIIGIMIFAQKEVDWSIFIRLQLAGFFLMILFTSLGLLISMFVSAKKNLMGLIVGLTFGTYLINALGKSTEATKWLAYFSPFNYFNLTIGDPTESFKILSALVMLLISVIAIFVSHSVFQKKDF
jgi:ABC-2 type transport system permease protein